MHTVVPVITEGPNDTYAMITGSVTFTCTATGIPLPTITWMDENDNSVLVGSDMIIDDITILSTLTLSSLQNDDFDNYTCTATNMFGSDNVITLLRSEFIFCMPNKSMHLVIKDSYTIITIYLFDL